LVPVQPPYVTRAESSVALTAETKTADSQDTVCFQLTPAVIADAGFEDNVQLGYASAGSHLHVLSTDCDPLPLRVRAFALLVG